MILVPVCLAALRLTPMIGERVAAKHYSPNNNGTRSRSSSIS
jgi:hypothetical protein